MEDYLKALYALREESGDGVVTTQSLADYLKVSAPSASAMVKKLATMKLANHTPYRGVELSEAGQKIALEVVRHHRLLETYLSQVLGLDWDKVHEEADRLEHVLSEELEARIAAALGNPQRDPHGSPIPTSDGVVVMDHESRLADAAAGDRLTVCRVVDENPELLRHLSDQGLRPDAIVEVVRAVAAEGVLHLNVNGQPKTLGSAPAQSVYVRNLAAPEPESDKPASPDISG